MIKMERRQLMNFGITVGNYSSFVNNIVSLARQRASSNVCVANVHMFIEAYQDKNLGRIINTADIVTPDGKPLAWALRLLLGVKQDRVAGMDLLPDLLQQLMVHNLPVYFYGGTTELMQLTEKFLQKNYPNLKLAGLYSPPFRQLTTEEEEVVVNRINSSGSSVVFVVLGCPKQEKWMAAMKGRINAVMIGVGGALPVMIGIQKRAPRWMQNAGLEWLFRLKQEPGRLLKRYAVTNSLFLYLLFKEYLAIRLFRKAV
jgi:N-acetylglucosaminyldiphosphoundecaprenol N-acetyl-beta-D-mannosaminyltransferase